MKDELLKLLDEFSSKVREQFPEAEARLEQLASHLGTVRMVVEHLVDEHERSQG